MAITNNGIKNDLPDSQIPSGYVRPTITEFTNETYKVTLTLNVLKVTVDVTDPKLTMKAIIEDVAIGLEKQVADIIANDFVATNTVETFGVWNQLTNNLTQISGKGDFLTDNAINFVCTVDVYIKIT